MANLSRFYSTAEAAAKLGISRDTLLRWFREKRVSPVPKDPRGWRIFADEDLGRIALEAGLVSTPSSETMPSGNGQLTLFEESGSCIPLSNSPIRLIQYLGSKFSILPQLLPYLKQVTPKGGVFFDIFAGTTCVGQSMLDHCTVLSMDSMIYSKIIGDVLIVGPSRSDAPLPSVEVIADSESYRTNKQALVDIYGELLSKESQILEKDDDRALYMFCSEFPTWWKNNHKDIPSNIRKFFSKLDFPFKNTVITFDPACLFTTYYAGTYFGLRQCIEIDSIRTSIGQLEEKGLLTSWQSKAYICALMAAMSSAVSSAGKHFAQPILTFNHNKEKSFSRKRCLSDRKVSIVDKLAEFIGLLNQRRYAVRGKNRSLMLEFEQIENEFINRDEVKLFVKKYLQVPEVHCIYADPPYTAQQYSRFYHILETLCLYDYPMLQKCRQGRGYTSGLYRLDRHYSAFCRITSAKASFKSLIKFAKELNSVLILSYSESKGLTGNRRMIKPDELSSLAKELNMEEEKIDLKHHYKPLNKTDKIVNGSNEVEQIYIFRNRSG